MSGVKPAVTRIDFDQPPGDPVALVQQWLADATRLDLPNPNAMTLATADEDGRPGARTVLLKQFDDRGAVFHSNRMSRKGRELEVNPRAALLLFWDVLERQIRIEGPVSETSEAESDAYFAQRDRGSQLGAWASQQSQPLTSRAALLSAHEEMAERFDDGPVPRPPHWGGYRIALDMIEFWEGGKHRLHNRLVYTPQGRDAWHTQHLFP